MSHPRNPVIGITCYGKGKDQERYSLPTLYVEAARRAGCRVVLFVPGEPDPLALLDLVDGLILAGGGDIHPSRYGQEPHEKLYGIDPERDETELALVREAIARRLPTLAICRGLQILNVALGGDLIQHLPDVVGERVLHRQETGRVVEHPVQISAQSQLAEVCGGPSIPIASLHHQAIGRLGEGLKPISWAEDGVIEAVELSGVDTLLAVQWHPEETAAKDPAQQRLFDWLASQARAR